MVDGGVIVGGEYGRGALMVDGRMVAFVLTNAGLMVGAKVDGTRISKVAS